MTNQWHDYVKEKQLYIITGWGHNGRDASPLSNSLRLHFEEDTGNQDSDISIDDNDDDPDYGFDHQIEEEGEEH